MKKINLQPLNDNVSVQTEARLLDALLANQCEVAMACEGQGICATCHVYVRQGFESLSPPTMREQRTLGLITSSNRASRLACQARVLGEGVVVELPEGMYLETSVDLKTLIGRRTEIPILHPKNGRVLIEKGKIITKSRIFELESEDLNVRELKSHTEEV